MINSMKNKEVRTPIATEMYLPNHSGVSKHREVTNNFYTKTEVDSEIDTDIVTHKADASAHHTRYTDAEAVTAVATDDAYLKNTGDTGTGTLNWDGAVVINESGADKDFRVEGDTDQNLIFTDALNDSVGIGNTGNLNIKLRITCTNDQLTALFTESSVSAAGNCFGIFTSGTRTSTANNSNNTFGLNAFARQDGSANGGGLVGGRYVCQFRNASGTWNMTEVGGVSSQSCEDFGNQTTANVTNMYEFRAEGADLSANTNVTNYRQIWIEDGTGGNVTNATGIELNKVTIGDTLNQGIWLNGDNVGADIVFGFGKDANMYYDGTDLVINPDNVGSGAVNIKGDCIFSTEGAGLVFAEMYTRDNTTQQGLTTTYAKITNFDTAGATNNASVSVANDQITFNKTGKYLINATISIESVTAGGSYDIEIQGFWNSTAQNNLHAHRSLAGGGGDRGSMTITGILDVTTASTTLELQAKHNSTGTKNVIFEDMNINAIMIGGT